MWLGHSVHLCCVYFLVRFPNPLASQVRRGPCLIFPNSFGWQHLSESQLQIDQSPVVMNQTLSGSVILLFLPPLLRLPCNELIFLWTAGQALLSYVCLAKLCTGVAMKLFRKVGYQMREFIVDF